MFLPFLGLTLNVALKKKTPALFSPTPRVILPTHDLLTTIEQEIDPRGHLPSTLPTVKSKDEKSSFGHTAQSTNKTGITQND